MPDSSAAPDAVVFDFDGVLFRGDSTLRYIRRRLRSAPWLLPLAIPAGAAFLASRGNPRAQSLASRVVLRTVFLGIAPEDVAVELRAAASELRDCALTDGIDTLRAHLLSGDRVLVDSAALEPFVTTFLAQHGLHQVTVSASSLGPARGGARLADHNFHLRKIERALLAGWRAPYTVVYSDSATDLPLLERAEQPVLINPARRTIAAVEAAALTSFTTEVWP